MTKEIDTLNAEHCKSIDEMAPTVTFPVSQPETAKVVVSDDDDCPRCGNTHEIEHPALGRIRCPRCTVREARKDSSGLKNLTAAEVNRAREAARMIDAAVRTALRGGKKGAYWIADPKLRVVDRIMQRWAVGHSNGGPAPENPESRPPPLDPDSQTVIDELLKDDGPTPDRVKYHVFAWYRTETPCPVIAMNLVMSERSIYRYHEVVLDWLARMFEATGHEPLIRMLRMI